MTRLNILSVGFVFSLIVLSASGILMIPFNADQTGLAAVIAGVFFIGYALAYRGRWKDVKRVAEMLTALGLFGTGVGFVMVLDDFEATRDISGLHTAIHTTIVGMAGWIWLTICRWVCEQ